MEKQNLNVLLAEDDVFDEFFVSRAITQECSAFDLRVAHDGAEARKALFDEDNVFDLILLDIKLPKISGSQLIQEITKDRRHRLTPVYVMTGLEDPDELERCRQAGAAGVIGKTIDQEKLSAEIRATVRSVLKPGASLL